jgi:hypothetical protein
MSSPNPSLNDFDSYEPWDPYDDPSQQQTQTNDLNDSYIHYSIEWKTTLNNRAIMRPDMEQDIVLAPAVYREHFFNPKLDDFRRKKNRSVRSEDTNIVVSVTQRKERDLQKRFDDTSIDWAVIENQLVAWGELYRAGKKLRLNLSFNYVDDSQSSTTSLGRTDKRGSSSTTRQMLAEGAAQLDAEQASTGYLSIWREVYNLTVACRIDFRFFAFKKFSAHGPSALSM